MDVLFALLCCVALVLVLGLGVGVTFYAEKFLGRRAYLVGWLIPIIIFVTLYALYHLWLRLLSCTPVDRVCGEPLQTLALIFVAVFCVVALANASAQFSFYLFRHPPAARQVSQANETATSSEITPSPELLENSAPLPESDSPTVSDETSLSQ